MFQHWLLISIILFQILYIHSNPTMSETTSHIIDENYNEYQRANNALIYFLKNILDEPNPYERTILLNQLREYLNRMCIIGYFGASYGDACQRIVHQTHINDNENSDTSNERHGIQKRFFCNGFIGCKSMSG